MLSYHFYLSIKIRSFGCKLEPRYIFGAGALDQ